MKEQTLSKVNPLSGSEVEEQTSVPGEMERERGDRWERTFSVSLRQVIIAT